MVHSLAAALLAWPEGRGQQSPPEQRTPRYKGQIFSPIGVHYRGAPLYKLQYMTWSQILLIAGMLTCMHGQC